MRKLLLVVCIAALAWSGYWYFGSRAVENGLKDWIGERRADAWQAEFQSLDTRGFPSRFDTTITDLHLANTRQGLAWKAPFFQILALSYRPNHIVAVWPPEQTIATPFETIKVTSELMRASLVLKPDSKLTLDRSGFDLGSFDLESDRGWNASIENGRFFTKSVETKEHTHDVWIEATRIRPSHAFKAAFDPEDLLPLTFQGITIDTELGFDGPWDLVAIEQAAPLLTNLKIRDLHMSWGELDLRIAGEVAIDRAGIPTGAITIKAKNWRDMVRLAATSGLLAPGYAVTVENVLEKLAGLSGSTKTLDTPLTFENGRMKLGPLPLGPAPKFKR